MRKTMVPMETTLYRRVAKDYSPKKAEMMICEYIEGLEARIEGLEAQIIAPEAANDTPSPAVASRRGKSPAAHAAAPTNDSEKEE